jgi:flavodoxin
MRELGKRLIEISIAFSDGNRYSNNIVMIIGVCMKKHFALLASVFLLIGGAAMAQSNSKILVAYFSWSGNNKTIAQQIAGETGGTLFEIRAKESYDMAYHPLTELAKKEQTENARPALSAKVSNIAQYDTVFIGYPMWWQDMPMAVFTFLESYDFAGKKIIPFCANGGSGFGESLDSLKKECPSSTILEGFQINAWAGTPREGKANLTAPVPGVSAWLKKIGFSGKNRG